MIAVGSWYSERFSRTASLCYVLEVVGRRRTSKKRAVVEKNEVELVMKSITKIEKNTITSQVLNNQLRCKSR